MRLELYVTGWRYSVRSAPSDSSSLDGGGSSAAGGSGAGAGARGTGAGTGTGIGVGAVSLAFGLGGAKLSGAGSARSETHSGEPVVPRFLNSASFVKMARPPARLPIMRASSGESSGMCRALVTR